VISMILCLGLYRDLGPSVGWKSRWKGPLGCTVISILTSPESLAVGWGIGVGAAAEAGVWADGTRVADSSRTVGVNEGSLTCSGYLAAHFS
jgi:hypothetical protein